MSRRSTETRSRLGRQRIVVLLATGIVSYVGVTAYTVTSAARSPSGSEWWQPFFAIATVSAGYVPFAGGPLVIGLILLERWTRLKEPWPGVGMRRFLEDSARHESR